MPTPPYVLAVRQKIGHDLLLLPAVTVLARDAEDRVLLVRHSHNGLWGVAGGMVEVDEAPEDAAMREAAEETGYDVELGAVLRAVGGPGYRFAYPNGDNVAVVQIVYDARVVGGESRPDGEEIVEVGWWRMEDIPSLDLSDFARQTFQDLGWL